MISTNFITKEAERRMRKPPYRKKISTSKAELTENRSTKFFNYTEALCLDNNPGTKLMDKILFSPFN
jgi:hypothetical protein